MSDVNNNAPARGPVRALSGWEKTDIVLKPVGGLLTALSVALVGIIGSQLLRDQQELETNTRLYAELMSSREQSDSSLRQEMFKTIIDDFLAPPAVTGADALTAEAVRASYRRDVLKLEILAYSFHDALDPGTAVQGRAPPHHGTRQRDEPGYWRQGTRRISRAPGIDRAGGDQQADFRTQQRRPGGGWQRRFRELRDAVASSPISS